MKKLTIICIAFFLSSCSFTFAASDNNTGQKSESNTELPLDHASESISDKHFQQIDDLFHKGSEQNYLLSGLEMVKQSLDLCLAAKEKEPENYEVLWRCARSAYKYAESAKALQIEGWKKICGKWGKIGMNIAGKAQEIVPNRVDAYFWQTACIGKYVDDAGIITAIKEGFHPKSTHAMAKAYEIDKSYYDFCPVFGSAMLNITPPWPIKDKKKALHYFLEHEKTSAWTWEAYIKYVEGAKLLLSLKKKKFKPQAKAMLEKALSDPNQRKYYHDLAKDLLKKIK